MQTAEALKYAKTIVGGLSLAFVLGCAQPDFKGETARERYPASEESRLDIKMSGYAEKDMKKLADEVGDLLKNLPESKEPYRMRDIDFSSDKGIVRLRITEENGWMPQKYVEMFDNALLRKEILSYKPYTAGIFLDANKNGVRDADEAELKKPLVVARKTDGTYCFFTYDPEMSKPDIGLPVINIYMFGPAMLSESISTTPGVVRTDWKPMSGKNVRKNCPLEIKTKSGTVKIMAPYLIDGTAVLDKELADYLKTIDALPKNRKILGE